MGAADVPAVLDVQEPGAVRALVSVFPQDTHPFPREEIGQLWLEEIESAEVDCYVVLVAGQVAGFAAVRADELLHFGVGLEHWGSGLARAAHDTVLDLMRSRGESTAWLRVFAGNGRGRRFYEKLGWTRTGGASRSDYPPYPELLRYERPLDGQGRRSP